MWHSHLLSTPAAVPYSFKWVFYASPFCCCCCISFLSTQFPIYVCYDFLLLLLEYQQQMSIIFFFFFFFLLLANKKRIFLPPQFKWKWNEIIVKATLFPHPWKFLSVILSIKQLSAYSFTFSCRRCCCWEIIRLFKLFFCFLLLSLFIAWEIFS